MTFNSTCALRATAPIDHATVDAHIEQLLHETFAGPLSIERIASLITRDPLDYARLGNLPPVEEGRMLEKAILHLASSNPDRTVFVGSRLPLHADGTLAKAGGTYKPDLILVHRATGIADLVDVKRSLKSYESSRIQHLKERMLTAAASLPTLLAQAGIGVDVSEIRIAVVSIDAGRSDLEEGVWSLAQLDRLLGVPGAAMRITALRNSFEQRTKAQFEAALQSLIDIEVRRRMGATASAGPGFGSGDVTIRLAQLSRDHA